MNTYKKKTEEPKPKKVRKARPLIDIINGNILTREDVFDHLPFLLFWVGLALIYIANGFRAEGKVREMTRLDSEIKELRSEYITYKSELMYMSKQSQVARMIHEKGLGLKESLEPPKKIDVNTREERKYQSMVE